MILATCVTEPIPTGEVAHAIPPESRNLPPPPITSHASPVRRSNGRRRFVLLPQLRRGGAFFNHKNPLFNVEKGVFQSKDDPKQSGGRSQPVRILVGVTFTERIVEHHPDNCRTSSGHHGTPPGATRFARTRPHDHAPRSTRPRWRLRPEDRSHGRSSPVHLPTVHPSRSSPCRCRCVPRGARVSHHRPSDDRRPDARTRHRPGCRRRCGVDLRIEVGTDERSPPAVHLHRSQGRASTSGVAAR